MSLKYSIPLIIFLSIILIITQEQVIKIYSTLIPGWHLTIHWIPRLLILLVIIGLILLRFRKKSK